MTTEKLNRANLLYDAIRTLENQLKHFEREGTNPLLYVLSNTCDRRPMEIIEHLEDKAKSYAKKLVSDELTKLRKEFEKL